MDHEKSDLIRAAQGNGHDSRHRKSGAAAEVNGVSGAGYAFLPAQRENGEALRPVPVDQLQATYVPASSALTVSVVIPTWNEAGNIARVLGQLSRFRDVVIVDAFSDDGTVEVARGVRPDVRVVQRPPRGKGDALRAGFALATGDVIVTMDADGSMDPGEVDVFLAMMAVGFDLVKGSRLACGGGSHDITTTRLLGNAALCKLANVMFHTRWTDLCYGYLALRRSCLPRLSLTADGFEIESQILSHAALAGLRIAEIPSVELPRRTGESHLDARRDGARVLRAMLAARLAPRARREAVALRPVSSEE
ncbi:MAG TPA: glycosyltransferase family 2 protein [Nocardioidaceae bacterium]|nr:glycosyltransferase family 2 protein [Nocardioidaceae bacterium]